MPRITESVIVCQADLAETPQNIKQTEKVRQVHEAVSIHTTKEADAVDELSDTWTATR